jgi:predicted metalloprotease
VTGRPGRGVLGRRGLVIGVAILVAVALLGGRRLLHAPTRVPAGIDQALAPFPAFAPATPARVAVGSRGDRGARYAAIATLGEADWRAAFTAAGRVWARPTWRVAMPPPSAPDPRARIVLEIGTQLGDWVQRLSGIPGLVGVGRRQGTVSAASAAIRTTRLDACLAGAWGRSLASPQAIARAAVPALRSWVARGAATGVPATCTAALGA